MQNVKILALRDRVKNLSRQLMVDILDVHILIKTYEILNFKHTTGPKVIKPFSYSTQLNMKFILLINVKMKTIVTVGILTLMSRINFWL